MIRNTQILSPAEMLYILNSDCKIEILVKYTFLDLYSRRALLIELRETTRNKYDYFIWPNEISLESMILDHEILLTNIFERKSTSYLSLIEYITELSNFVNEKFRALNKKYKFEKYLERCLLGKGLIKKQQGLLSLFSRYAYTKEGEKIKKKLKSEFTESITPSSLHHNMLTKLETETIKLSSLIKINELFDDLFKKALLNREWVVMPMAEFGKEYPIPKNFNPPK